MNKFFWPLSNCGPATNLSTKRRRMILSFRMPQFKKIFTKIDTVENDQNLYLKVRGSGPHSRSHGCDNFYRVPSISSAMIFEFLFLTMQKFLPISKCRYPTVYTQNFPTASLCTRDVDGCQSERTAAQ